MSILENSDACWSLYADDLLKFGNLSNTGVESNFLGTLLNDPSLLDELKDAEQKLPNPSDFSHPTTALLYEAIQEFSNRYGAEALNPSRLLQFIEDNQDMFTLKVDNQLFQIKATFLSSILINYRQSGHSFHSAKCDIDIILELSQRRKLYKLSLDAQNISIDPNGKSALDIAYALQDGSCKVIESNSSRTTNKGRAHYEGLVSFIKTVHDNMENGTVDRGLLSGVQSIDELTRGFKKGSFNILAARAGIGKTALACQIAYHNARDENQQRPVFFFSLEMTEQELLGRYCASVSKCSVEEISEGRISNANWMAIIRDSKLFEKNDEKKRPYKLTSFFDRSSISPIEIRSILNSFIRTHDGVAPCLIIIDYLQLMTLKVNEPLAPQYAYAAYKEIAQELKDIAQDFDLAVLVLSQVSRSPNGKNELPTPELLRGSFGINDVSDLTFFLHCPDLKNKEEMIVSVAKNRKGSTGETTVYYDGPHFTFYDK